MTPPPPTVLVIDDEPAVLDFMSRSLDRSGFRVLRADSAERALELARPGEIDLIVSDVNMPGLQGPDLVRRLKSSGVACPVMFTSGDPSFEVVDDSLRVPGATFLPKPFRSEELVQAVFETLGQR